MNTKWRALGVGMILGVVALGCIAAMTTNPPGIHPWSGASASAGTQAPVVATTNGVVLWPTNGTWQGWLSAPFGMFGARLSNAGPSLIVLASATNDANNYPVLQVKPHSILDPELYLAVYTNGLVRVGHLGLATNSPPADPNTVVGWVMITNYTGGGTFRLPLYQ